MRKVHSVMTAGEDCYNLMIGRAQPKQVSASSQHILETRCRLVEE